jgi:hypothetical protein
MTPSERLRQYHQALEARDFVAIETMFDANARYRSVGLGDIVGRDAIMSSLRAYFLSHPDHHAWDESVEDVSEFAARATWRLQASDSVTGFRINRSGTELIQFTTQWLIEMIAVEDN